MTTSRPRKRALYSVRRLATIRRCSRRPRRAASASTVTVAGLDHLEGILIEIGDPGTRMTTAPSTALVVISLKMSAFGAVPAVWRCDT